MSASGTLGALRAEVAACTSCELCETRIQAVAGQGPNQASLLIVGEAPGALEDESGAPFVGRSGALLLALVDEVLGLDRSRCFITNVVKCRPPANRPPSAVEIDACADHLDAELAMVSTAVVVTVGNTATRAVLGTREGITSLRGLVHRAPRCDAPVVPTYHPAAALRGGAMIREAMRADLALARPYIEGGVW